MSIIINPTTNKYEAKINIPSIKSSIKIYRKDYVGSSMEGLIIISWQAQASASKVHDYIIHVIKILSKFDLNVSPPSTTYTYTEITKQFFYGTFYDATTPSINGPTVLISPSFKNIVAYGKDTASSYYSFGGYMDY
jgi:hypothetical protein